jgi:hypothetical protein
MAKDQNFDNGTQEFNIRLEDNGELHFKANGKNGGGSTRMIIADDSGQVTIGGSGQFGQLQLTSSTGANTLFLGGTGSETTALIGGADQSGRVQLFDSSHRRTVDLNGANGVVTLGTEGIDGDLVVLDSDGDTTIQVNGDTSNLKMFSAAGTMRVDLQGDIGRLELLNSSGVVTADLRGDDGSLTLGANGSDGDITLRDSGGNATITLDGATGEITCDHVTESDRRLKTNIVPLTNALDRVLALRGVRYQRNHQTAPRAADTGDAEKIGFVAQEVEEVFPEFTATNADGYKSVNYARMTAVLVEAVKEQQRLIRAQAAALGEALRKISTIEAGLATSPAAQHG